MHPVRQAFKPVDSSGVADSQIPGYIVKSDAPAPKARGERGADMVKAIYLIKRKQGMELEAFRNYWLTTHADLALKVPGLRKYVQSHTQLSGYKKGEPLYDGIAEVWYDDTDAMRRIAELPEARAVNADGPVFMDMRASGFILTREHVIKDGAVTPSMLKYVAFAKCKPGMDVQAYQTYWKEHHGPLAAKIPVVHRYVQSHPLMSAYRGGLTPLCDGVAETWFDDTNAMRVSQTTPEYQAVRADEPNFVDISHLAFIITQEHVML
jgi:uncharacterized protein (TIGR02118 family)